MSDADYEKESHRLDLAAARRELAEARAACAKLVPNEMLMLWKSRADSAEAELARRATGDETTSEGYYRREWELACERVRAADERAESRAEDVTEAVYRVEAAEAERDRLRAALREVRPIDGEHWQADNGERLVQCRSIPGECRCGADEHRAIIDAALAGSAPVPAPRDNETAPPPSGDQGEGDDKG